MNKTISLSILLIILLIGLAWFGVSRWQRSSILSGDRDVLLIDKKNNTYSFLSSSDADDIESSAKIIGFVDELSESEIENLIKEYAYSGSKIGPYTPTSPSVDVQTPQEEERAEWERLLTTISSEQQLLCESMPIADLAQFCIVNHIIYTAILNQQTAETTCPGIFVETYRAQCDNHFENKGIGFADKDQNDLLDAFELYTGKADQFRSQ